VEVGGNLDARERTNDDVISLITQSSAKLKFDG
jgi:hypothetical protein